MSAHNVFTSYADLALWRVLFLEKHFFFVIIYLLGLDRKQNMSILKIIVSSITGVMILKCHEMPKKVVPLKY